MGTGLLRGMGSWLVLRLRGNIASLFKRCFFQRRSCFLFSPPVVQISVAVLNITKRGVWDLGVKFNFGTAPESLLKAGLDG